MATKIDIVGLGDSLTYGYPYGPEASWLHLVAQRTGLVVENRGVNGETTGEMLARFHEDVLRLEPRAVIIMGGTNDAWAGVEVSRVRENVRVMVEKAREGGIAPVIALPPPLCRADAGVPLLFLTEMASLLESYREAYRELTAKEGLMLLDFYTPLVDPATGWGRGEYFVDDAHPNRRGYQVMAEAVLGKLLNLLQGLF
ncbi:MAG: SGNH/GDSL hydrolase family protein [Thermoanaerobacteraceae bacterium]|uniref:SGNH/GDSL hydrolase family protein n=1 Tax=Thermanaeromonas sp. C210 TaxID=2731925 RepID=UPI00155D3512|nr:SGNH/GDSL hydrolase family protein [Thermanaeromonas sp. C210]MBE3580539.1 SGNH/GDSL hydrolase family protein [Thermoanaerobacteraceae bacterium]GFN22328.1 lipolytic protein [Thermanaeromonas sp. C210]